MLTAFADVLMHLLRLLSKEAFSQVQAKSEIDFLLPILASFLVLEGRKNIRLPLSGFGLPEKCKRGETIAAVASI